MDSSLHTQDLFQSPVPNLPTIHEDESAYSWYRRIALMNGTIEPVLLSQRLFDSRFSALAHDLPERVSCLTEALQWPPDSDLSFARQHTLAGYFLPFMDRDRTALFRSYIRDGHPKDLKARIGLPASRVTSVHPLKACRSCVEADIDRRGYAYWRVAHQAPSSWICLEHKELLATADLQRSPRHFRTWLAPDSVKLNQVGAGQNRMAHSVLEKLAKFTARVPEVPGARLSAEVLSQVYRVALQKQGFATDTGVIRLRELVPYVKQGYRGCRALPGFRILDSISEDWAGLIGIARRSVRSAHPFKHLLLITFLFVDWEEFICAVEFVGTKERDHAVPPPKDQDDRLETFRHLVTELGLSLAAAGRQVGISATTATQWAAKLGLPYTSRTKALDAAQLTCARSLLRQGRSREHVADAISMSATSITRLLAREPDLRDAWQAAIFRKRRERNRRAFLKLVQSNPGVPIKVLRRIPGNGYMWLYRNDRDWLIENMPALPPMRRD